MARIDPSLVEVLKELPPSHRRFLVMEHAARLPTSQNVDAKIEALAALIGASGINRYKNLYLPGNGSVFAWYIFRNVEHRLPAIYNRVTREHRGVLTGLEPEMEPGEDPKLHRLIDYQGHLVLEFGARDSLRVLRKNWRQRKEYVDRTYRVVIRNDPFTTELRASSRPKQEALLRSLEAILGFGLSGGVKIMLTTQPKYDSLQSKLTARFCNVVFSVNGRGLSRTEFDADEISHLEKLADYIAQRKLPNQDEHSRTYDFRTKHADGYEERAFYTINLDTGNLSLNADISELAIENLRKNVIASS